jgi:hypothetical protein
MNGNMYTEIQQHGSYDILILGPCNEWEKYISGLLPKKKSVNLVHIRQCTFLQVCLNSVLVYFTLYIVG